MPKILKKYQNPRTLRSLLNELARLTVFSTGKQASLFDRDMRVYPCLISEKLLAFLELYLASTLLWQS